MNGNVTTNYNPLKNVSHKFMGGSMTLDMRKGPSSAVAKPRNVLAVGLVDLKCD